MYEILRPHVAEVHLKEFDRWVASREEFAEPHASGVVAPWRLGEVMCFVIAVAFFVVVAREGEFHVKVCEAEVRQVWCVERRKDSPRQASILQLQSMEVGKIDNRWRYVWKVIVMLPAREEEIFKLGTCGQEVKNDSWLHMSVANRVFGYRDIREAEWGEKL